MKKKVLYGAGIAGLAPAAALMAPGAATAAPAATHPAQAKTVSKYLHGRVHPDTCTGTKDAQTGTAPILKSHLSVWYTSYSQSTCIGTVTATTNQYSPYPTGFRVRIWHNGNLADHHSVGVHALPGDSTSGTTAFHAKYAHPAEVCIAWKISGQWFPSLCLTRG